MFAYDSASSSSSSSTPPLHHPFRRKAPPSPPHRHVSHLYAPPSPRPYSPSSREADVARLLDPAYASPAPHSPLRSSKMLPKAVYVDHHGDLHDPDYRDFPPFGPSHIHSRRPRWERSYGDDNVDDDDDDDDDDKCDPEPRRPSFDLQPRRPSSTITYHPSPVYYPYEEPASYESRYLVEEVDEEVDPLERTPLKENSFYCRSRSPAKRPKSQDEKRSPASGGDQVIEGDSEWTPTCTQNLRRHWQAITLSLRFSLFRTKRRLRRRLTG